MIIRELHLKNFGKFCGKSLWFADGINVIYGQNEAGKTTVYEAICALLFGLEKQRGRAARCDTYTTYQPWENRTWYEGSLKFITGGKIFHLERNFYHGEKSAHLFCETDGEELSVEDGDLEMLLGDVGAELYRNTAAVGQLKMKPQDIVYSYLKNHIAGVQEEGKNATDVVKALSILENRKKLLEKERKQKSNEIYKRLDSLDAGMELLQKETTDYTEQIKTLEKRKSELKKAAAVQKRKGLLPRFLFWLKGLFFRKRIREEAQTRRENILKVEEKIKLIQELLGEKESQKEEFLLEKELLYEELHKQSKEEEIRAIDFAMERINELSAVRKEEVMEQLLDKASKILGQITDGRYQKLILQENEEPAVWDGRKVVKLFQLSAGCVEQVYLAVRIGLQDLFFKEDTLPLLFDDAFVYFDDERLEQILLCLSQLGRQVLLFSCHRRELDILEKHHLPYQKILL